MLGDRVSKKADATHGSSRKLLVLVLPLLMCAPSFYIIFIKATSNSLILVGHLPPDGPDRHRSHRVKSHRIGIYSMDFYVSISATFCSFRPSSS